MLGFRDLAIECKAEGVRTSSFDYASNCRRNVLVWPSARRALVVNLNPQVASQVAKMAQIERVIEDRRKRPFQYLEALRPRHWLKNLLVFVPLVAAHRVLEIALLKKAALAFLAFGCFASSGYLAV